MSYAGNGVYHDADSHIFESPEFYSAFADSATLRLLGDNCFSGVTIDMFEDALRARDNAEFVAQADAQLMERKLWNALGAYDGRDRSRALDLMGFRSQLVFDSFMRFHLRTAEQGDDLDLVYGLARTHNRALVEFCSSDPRLLPVGYVPLADIERSIAFAEEAIELGCAALQTPADCPRHHSPSHRGFDPMWALMAESSTPLIFHLGAGRLADPTYNISGRDPEPSFLGGDGSIKSIEYIATPHPVMESLSALLVDGVLHDHPDLRIGVIEFGASWVPGWLHFLDSAMDAFVKTERRLQRLDMKLSDYVRRQVRVTPFCHENTGWTIAQGGDDMFMFSSDYPHIEGGRNPIARFERSLDASNISAEAREKFYSRNFEDFMGARVRQFAGDGRPRIV